MKEKEKEKEKNKPAVGIDFGTSNSCVSIWMSEKGRAKSVRGPRNQDGSKPAKTAPSVAFLDAEGVVQCACEDAALRAAEEPSNGCMVDSVKMLLGRGFNDETVQRRMVTAPFHICQSTKFVDWIETSAVGTRIAITAHGASGSKGAVSPEEVTAAILKTLVGRAEAYLDCNDPIRDVVITVPAYFNETQKTALNDAADIAGLRVLRLLSEPMAAASAYGLTVAGEKTVMVTDLGGGTFDLCVMRITSSSFETIALGGNSLIGGKEIDVVIMEWCAKTLDINLKSLNVSDKAKLLRKCEKAKIELSAATYATIDFNLRSLTLELAEFEELITPLIEQFRKDILELTDSLPGKKDDIDEIVLVGLPTATPLYRRMVEVEFPNTAICKSINPSLAVSQGAAIQAAILQGEDLHRMNKLLMLDVLPYSIGYEARDGSFEIALARNTKIPAIATKRYFTTEDNAAVISLDIFEGEDECARNNNWMGYYTFIVPNGRKFKAGERSMNITFRIEDDGQLYVSAEAPSEEAELCESEAGSGHFYLLLVLFIAVFALYVALKTSNLDFELVTN